MNAIKICAVQSNSDVLFRPVPSFVDSRIADGNRPLVVVVASAMSFATENTRQLGPPLAALSIGALARRAGWDVFLVDLPSLGSTCVLPRRPALVAVNINTATAPIGYAVARAFREDGVPTIVGGAHPSVAPAEALSHSDAVFVGEAEQLFGGVLSDVMKGEMRTIYSGARPSMDLAPRPHEYSDLVDTNSRAYMTPASYQTTRGCRYNCAYCSVIRINGRGQRHRPVEMVVEDFRYLRSLAGVRYINVVDDDLASDLARSDELAEALIKARVKIPWGSQSSVGIADHPEILSKLRRAGLRGLSFGLESIERSNLVSVNKKNRPHRYKTQFDRVNAHGIDAHATFILGLPSDTVDSLRLLEDSVDQLGLKTANFSILTPLPGTELFADMAEQRLISTFDWALYNGFHCVIRHPKLTARQLQVARAHLQARFGPRGRNTATRKKIERLAAVEVGRSTGWVSAPCTEDQVRQLVAVSRSPASDVLEVAVRLNEKQTVPGSIADPSVVPG